ncbi:MAG: gamma-glutamyl-gamma-aminobutyrate hydrolase family protein [Caldilineales bacterium]|nr:gamma-glutamyl-gamma-aminobutyrate hydrolase family protein [Caldilineales bacterium]
MTNQTSSSRPRIGFTSREENIDYFLKWQRDYWFAIQSAGGEPVRLVPEEVQDFESTLDGLDGLLLTGGGDVHPAYYDQDIDGADPASIFPERDRLEIGLVRAAAARHMPIFGICRGFQVLNVALGGSLIQHTEGHSGKTNSFEGPRPHEVSIRPGSLLDRTLACGPSVLANSYHHQAVRPANLAAGLAASGWAEDGVIEALESPNGGWILGVQWHPERLYELGTEHRRLFDGFVAASRNGKSPD